MQGDLCLNHEKILEALFEKIHTQTSSPSSFSVFCFQTRTHHDQLCSAIYNPFYKQVVTGADDSSVSVWDVETGDRCITFNRCHQDNEITCLTFDHSLRRLITGERTNQRDDVFVCMCLRCVYHFCCEFRNCVSVYLLWVHLCSHCLSHLLYLRPFSVLILSYLSPIYLLYLFFLSVFLSIIVRIRSEKRHNKNLEFPKWPKSAAFRVFWGS